MLDLLSRLVDKSLVMVDDGSDGRGGTDTWRRCGSTLGTAATVRRADVVRDRHFGYFLELARRAEPELTKAEQLRWLADLQLDHDNFRAALDWRLSSDSPECTRAVELASAPPLVLVEALLPRRRKSLARNCAREMAAPPIRRAATR